MTREDTDLLVRLGALARLVDPAPAFVRELGRAAFGLRSIDTELAELADDTEALAGVRGGGSAVRLLTFQTGEVVVEAQVSLAGRSGTVLGQVVVASLPEGMVRLESTEHSTAASPLDEVGSFRFDGVPPGLVRLVVELSGARALSSSWFRV